MSNKVVKVQRRGGKYEGIGFLMMLLGLGLLFFSGSLGGLIAFAGLVVFIIGRCM